MSLLIDADFIVYKCTAACEVDMDFGDDVIVVTSSFSEAYKMVLKELQKIADNTGVFDDSILFFSDAKNFRKDLKGDYKGHRNRKKPCGYRRVIEALKADFEVVRLPYLEADDALGIWATRDQGHIVCSPDKDLRQIPGLLYDMTNEVVEITKEEGDRWHFIQTMAGDNTDGYSGVPGIGVKRADSILKSDGCTWDTVLKTFKSKDLDEGEALLNARLAKILQVDNYDFRSNKVKQWTPATSKRRADNGAAVQATAA